jgi:outer membrane biogenesis lipoprotein LolB
MRRHFILFIALLALTACGARVHVKGGSETAPKWKITKPF